MSGVVRTSRRLAPDTFRHLRGPFDIVGDVHGCRRELDALVSKLGYPRDGGAHPGGRRLVFVGDLVDRGPDAPGVLRRVMGMAQRGGALCVLGNHERRLQRHLMGQKVQLTYGLDRTVAQLAHEPEAFLPEVGAFLQALPAHLCLDAGALVVAHAGLPEALHGSSGGRAKAFATFGPKSGALPNDPAGGEDWPAHYRGEAYVVHGHYPTQTLAWWGRALNLDTGCVFGGRLSALRYPEMDMVWVDAEKAWEPTVRWNVWPPVAQVPV